MAQPVIPDGPTGLEDASDLWEPRPAPRQEVIQLELLWGTDLCRLEYLLHLVETGRINAQLGA